MAKKTETPEQANTRGRRIEVIGEVISDKMQKTISVLINRTVRHSRYGKFIKRSSVLKAHDEKNEAKVGDKVRVYETRRLSKTKRWMLDEVVEKARKSTAEVEQ